MVPQEPLGDKFVLARLERLRAEPRFFQVAELLADDPERQPDEQHLRGRLAVLSVVCIDVGVGADQALDDRDVGDRPDAPLQLDPSALRLGGRGGAERTEVDVSAIDDDPGLPSSNNGHGGRPAPQERVDDGGVGMGQVGDEVGGFIGGLLPVQRMMPLDLVPREHKVSGRPVGVESLSLAEQEQRT